MLWESDLPKWKEGRSASAVEARRIYVEKLSSHWGIPEEAIKKLGRKARAYFGIAIPDLEGNSMGVLMVDAFDPLTNVSKSARDEIVSILDVAVKELTPLLHIRYSL
ncbi:MAG: hypothetical protein WC477_02730 [Patescibacteria group bacterium]